ncbi:putative biphenyl-2,3-diol 1,2-dioxygenase III [Lepidopterella palustris CBS 459.81]|uniref:Putative biphenyl-2,3-diol 1,2-dioxygenase III n=1 Tax=Lepidopterella palustris CBS 459.81 TaxID=1314670 RepID=A0A8E2E689_9PEZI|nr:putative biphenyl-2,3-diol 1,2-dioxygenase III [Lepidopterella palustris CBS 459.81]
MSTTTATTTSAPATKTARSNVKSPSALAHVVLRTSNYVQMVRFYKDFLGAHASYENDALSFLTYDNEHHRLAICNIPGTGPKAPTSAGLEHLAFSFDSLDDLALTYRQRKALGMCPVWSVNHGPTTSIYYRDPDGNTVETQCDNFDTVEGANAFMSGSEFAENPFGVDFDPEVLCERLARGESSEVIKRRVEIGPRGIETLPIL